MTHSRSIFSIWLSLIIVFLPSLALELLRPFNAAYAFLFALIIGPALYGLMRTLCHLYSGQPLLDRTESLFGHRITLGLIICYFILTAFLCALFIEDFGTRIVHSLMLHSDARFYNVTLLVVAALFARAGIRTLGRMAEILLPLFSLLLLLLSFPIFFGTPTSGLFPFPVEALQQFFPGGLALSILLGAGSLLFICGRDIQITPHSKKQCLYAAFLAAVYALLFPLLTTQLLGRFLTEETTSSFFLGLRQFKLFGAFGNTQVLVIIPWMILALPVCAYFLWGLSELLRRLFPKLSDAFRHVLCPLVVLVILAIRNEWNPYLSASLWIGVIPLGLLLFYGVPVILTLLDRRKIKQPSEDG